MLTERKPGVPLPSPSDIHHLPISPGAGSPLPHGLTSAAARQSAFLAQPGPAVWLMYPAPALPGSVQCPVPASGILLPLRCRDRIWSLSLSPPPFTPVPGPHEQPSFISENLVLASGGLIRFPLPSWLSTFLWNGVCPSQLGSHLGLLLWLE